MATAFQTDAFQNDSFQIEAPGAVDAAGGIPLVMLRQIYARAARARARALEEEDEESFLL